MRKPAFSICKNKDADQLWGNCAADQHLCFPFIDSTIPLVPNYKFQVSNHLLALFVSDLIGNPEDRFSHDRAHINHTSDNPNTELSYMLGSPAQHHC